MADGRLQSEISRKLCQRVPVRLRLLPARRLGARDRLAAVVRLCAARHDHLRGAGRDRGAVCAGAHRLLRPGLCARRHLFPARQGNARCRWPRRNERNEEEAAGARAGRDAQQACGGGGQTLQQRRLFRHRFQPHRARSRLRARHLLCAFRRQARDFPRSLSRLGQFGMAGDCRGHRAGKRCGGPARKAFASRRPCCGIIANGACSAKACARLR